MIAVIGGGLSGLTCAKCLQEAGADYVLFEASDKVGGRVRTRYTADGFTLDEGFQVLLDSYPAVERHLDLIALDPAPLDSGVLMWDEGDFFRLQSPLRHPAWLLTSALSDAFSFMDRLKAARLVANVIGMSDEVILSRCGSKRDRKTWRYLQSQGFSDDIMERFFRPFFGGVFLDNELSVSCGLFRYYLKKFATGKALLPSGGIGEVPAQLASHIPADRIRKQAAVDAIQHAEGRATGIHLGSELVKTDMIVLATDASTTARLLGFPEPEWLGTRVHYFTTNEAFYTGATIVLPAGPHRTARHFIDLTNARPDLAPAGKRLISATVIGEHLAQTADQTGQLVQREIEEIFPAVAGKLTPLETIEVPHAVPVQGPEFASSIPVTPYAGLRIAGDQKLHASIQGAMQAGEEAAEAALAAVQSQAATGE